MRFNPRKALEAVMDHEKKQQLALKFLSILGKPDASVVRDVAVEDMIWTFPGTSQISGEAHGIDAILNRAHTIASYMVKVEVVRTVYGFSGVSVILHNTGEKDGRVLDEHLAAVFAFRGDKIERLDTHLSDVPMVKAFFG
jgi:ketosteroid isomerase-like protein